MARYIDADAVCEALKSMASVQLPDKQSTILGVVSSIENFPTANVALRADWISTEERLPDNNTERVLVFLMDDAFTKPIGENKIDTDRFVDGKWVRWSRFVTHWMPLPEPPKNP